MLLLLSADHNLHPPVGQVRAGHPCHHARRQVFELVDVARQLKRQKGGAPLVSPPAKEAWSGSIRSSRSSGRSTGGRPPSAGACARNESFPWSTRWKSRCARSDAAFRVTTLSPKRSPTRRSTGRAHDLPRRRPDLPQQQRRRARAAQVARRRKAWSFVGSDRGGERAAMMYSPIGAARLNGRSALLAHQRARPHRRSAADSGSTSCCLEMESASARRTPGNSLPDAAASNRGRPHRCLQRMRTSMKLVTDVRRFRCEAVRCGKEFSPNASPMASWRLRHGAPVACMRSFIASVSPLAVRPLRALRGGSCCRSAAIRCSASCDVGSARVSDAGSDRYR